MTEEKVSYKIECSANLRTFNTVNIVPCAWIINQQRISQDGERKCPCYVRKLWEDSKWNSVVLKFAASFVCCKLWPLMSPLVNQFVFVMSPEVHKHERKLKLNPIWSRDTNIKLLSEITTKRFPISQQHCILVSRPRRRAREAALFRMKNKRMWNPRTYLLHS